MNISVFLRFMMMIAALAILPALAKADTFTVYGRMRVQGDSARAKCEICIDCEGWSGGTVRSIQCEPMEYMNGTQVQASVQSQFRNKRCELSVLKVIKILSPGEHMPEYPDKKELRSLLDCKKVIE